VWPVGSIYMSVNNTNPSAYLPGTSWTAWGSGRVPVGVDTSQTEFNNAEKTGGEKTHTLTVNEMPSHNHDYTLRGLANYDRYDYNSNGGYWGYLVNGEAGAKTASSGSGLSHNNLQPYIVCYMWKRTG
jgi:hypothetical protein